MKQFLCTLGSVVIGSPIVIAGRGIQHTGRAVSATGNIITSAGIVTEVAGTAVKDTCEAAADEAGRRTGGKKVEKLRARAAMARDAADTLEAEAATLEASLDTPVERPRRARRAAAVNADALVVPA